MTTDIIFEDGIIRTQGTLICEDENGGGILVGSRVDYPGEAIVQIGPWSDRALYDEQVTIRITADDSSIRLGPIGKSPLIVLDGATGSISATGISFSGDGRSLDEWLEAQLSSLKSAISELTTENQALRKELNQLKEQIKSRE